MKYSFDKFSGNPVYGSRSLGTCFDVYVTGKEGAYRMDFSWRREDALAVAFSADGIHWSEPQITLPPLPGSAKEQRVNRNCVIKDGEKWLMYYTGQNETQSYIFLAESDDGINFKRCFSEPILSPETEYEGFSVMNPCVIKENGVYRMWYSSGETYEPNVLCYAESMDGIHFKRCAGNPILTACKEAPWEQDRLGGCHVLHTEDMGYVLFYIGYEDINTARICVARSADGIGGWERSALNPLVGSDSGRWDGDATYKPSAIWLPTEGKWRVYYNGRLAADEFVGFAEYSGRNLF